MRKKELGIWVMHTSSFVDFDGDRINTDYLRICKLNWTDPSVPRLAPVTDWLQAPEEAQVENVGKWWGIAK